MMEEGKEKQESHDEKNTPHKQREEIFSQAIKAGKRTYFFDVKATHNNDYYLTITESKKQFNQNGRFFYEKHKLFLYREDFEKFAEALNTTIAFIKSSNLQMASLRDAEQNQTVKNNYSDIQFEDLKGEEKY